MTPDESRQTCRTCKQCSKGSLAPFGLWPQTTHGKLVQPRRTLRPGPRATPARPDVRTVRSNAAMPTQDIGTRCIGGDLQWRLIGVGDNVHVRTGLNEEFDHRDRVDGYLRAPPAVV